LNKPTREFFCNFFEIGRLDAQIEAVPACRTAPQQKIDPSEEMSTLAIVIGSL